MRPYNRLQDLVPSWNVKRALVQDQRPVAQGVMQKGSLTSPRKLLIPQELGRYILIVEVVNGTHRVDPNLSC